MEILFGILSWDFGDHFGSAFDSWWVATGWLSVVLGLLVVVAYVGLQAYSYVMDERSPFQFVECVLGTIGIMIGTFGFSLWLLVALMFWELSVAVIGLYGLLRTARGVVRLRKALHKHIEDKNAHGKEVSLRPE